MVAAAAAAAADANWSCRWPVIDRQLFLLGSRDVVPASFFSSTPVLFRIGREQVHVERTQCLILMALHWFANFLCNLASPADFFHPTSCAMISIFVRILTICQLNFIFLPQLFWDVVVMLSSFENVLTGSSVFQLLVNFISCCVAIFAKEMWPFWRGSSNLIQVDQLWLRFSIIQTRSFQVVKLGPSMF